MSLDGFAIISDNVWTHWIYANARTARTFELGTRVMAWLDMEAVLTFEQLVQRWEVQRASSSHN